MKDPIKEIIECADEIHLNACKARLEWSGSTPDRNERERILMELRHDAQDILTAVAELEEVEEAAAI